MPIFICVHSGEGLALGGLRLEDCPIKQLTFAVDYQRWMMSMNIDSRPALANATSLTTSHTLISQVIGVVRWAGSVRLDFDGNCNS